MNNPQTWLSLTGICTTLNLSHGQVKWLAKNGFLTVIWGDKVKTWAKARYLDPTPEYAAKLKLGEALYDRLNPIPIDLDLTPMLTIREVAVIMGWSQRYARTYAWKRKVPSVKVGVYNLYSIATVRDMLWRRNGRGKLSKQVAPFLISDIIDLFRRLTAEAEQEVPADAELFEDELTKRRLERIGRMKSPRRERAMEDFYAKVAIAKSAIESTSR